MIPAFFTQVEDFALNQNGKIDRKLLMSPSLEQYKTDYVVPQSDEEIKIAKAFEEILNVEKIGLNDNFFMLGGDSIKTIMLLEKADLNLSPADIMNAKTVKNIAELTAEMNRGTITTTKPFVIEADEAEDSSEADADKEENIIGSERHQKIL